MVMVLKVLSIVMIMVKMPKISLMLCCPLITDRCMSNQQGL